MKKSLSLTGRKKSKKKRKFKVSSVTIWIGIEILAVLVMGTAVLIHNVNGEEAEAGPAYKIPTAGTSAMGLGDIELPTDLYEGSEDMQGAVGDLYSMDYDDDIIDDLSSMSIEEKADMIFVTTPESLCGKPLVTVAGDILKDAYRADPVTGLIFTDSNFTSESAQRSMLANIRRWSKDKTGMSLLLGYMGSISDAEVLSGRGINLYCLSPGASDEEDVLKAAADQSMVAAYYINYEQAKTSEETDVLCIVNTGTTQEITDLVNTGGSYLYMTQNFASDRDGLVEAVNDGRVPVEALDKAAGYALYIRRALTEMRPEDLETAAVTYNKPAASTGKAAAKPAAEQAPAPAAELTPEQKAAEAAKEAQKQAEEAQKAAQKQIEEAVKEMQKQAEEAAAAAAAAAKGQ